MKKLGFTLLELLVAISIISILTTVIFTSLAEARMKARAVNTLNQFEEIEKALKTYIILEDVNQWWELGDGSGLHRNDINYMRANLNQFHEFIPHVNESVTQTPSEFEYFNNGSAYNCGYVHNNGVSIRIPGVAENDMKLIEYLDNTVDGGDGDLCGTIRWGGSSESLYYLIASDSTDI